jgi:hypothetical protein
MVWARGEETESPLEGDVRTGIREVAWLLGPVTHLRWHSAARPVILAAIARHTVTGALEGYRIARPELVWALLIGCGVFITHRLSIPRSSAVCHGEGSRSPITMLGWPDLGQSRMSPNMQPNHRRQGSP